jgi:cell division protein FtsQ
VREDDLMRALEGFPVVRAIDVSADFPNGLRVHVIEHHPAALIRSGSSKVPVAADGSVLRGLPATGSLPRIEAPGAISADQIRDTRMLALVGVAGAAPGPLARRMETLEREKERGIVVKLGDGPELVFGTPARVRDKWLAAARVLADESSQGAVYLDLRMPDRPAAGGVVEEPVEPVEPVPVTPVEPVPAEPQP